ncbi:MAG: thioredoxin domain-containing protein [Candidatus Lokiarchaeota archaeon]|nr:thioredoxin domain-containing protein [Candidatus Lokiarchaeota archaeon]
MDNIKNMLGDQLSPYLIQHAKNPVNWYPWSEEAFIKAKREDKPIFLSIGYSTCHWCHVMAHESFEDLEVAQLLNESFISIKVDREERPDIDGVYMTVCQLMTGSGGWPLTILMTPDKKPFFAGTYFPKETRFGKIGLIELLERVKTMWKIQKDELLYSADQISTALQNIDQESPGALLDKKTLEKAFEELQSRFDKDKGGFGTRPKFPTPHNLIFLLRYWKRTGEKSALEMVKKTLLSMRRGGIYDHVGFGIHRYSMDNEWLVPHFEKMLYDQALVAIACVETFQATEMEEFKTMAEEIFTYLRRDMTSPEGGFYSAEDADSEGEEGKFYLWKKEELQEVLNEEQAKLLIMAYNIEQDGNYFEESTGQKTKLNILHLKENFSDIAWKASISELELTNQLEKARKILLKHRSKRVRPHKDDKILTDWNGLVIAALSKGYQSTNNVNLLKMAKDATDFVLLYLKKANGRLLHAYRDGKASLDGFLTDYSFFIWGLIELYEATFNVFYLKTALDLQEMQIIDFWDDNIGGFYLTAKYSEELLTRQKDLYDGALPSGNSIAFLNLLRLSYLTGNHELEKKADILSRVFTEGILKHPSSYTQMLIGVDFMIGPTFSVVIAGDKNAPDTQQLVNYIRVKYIPNKTFILRNTENHPPEIDAYTDFLKYFDKSDDKATAYVCANQTCKPATRDVGKLLELLDSKWS